MAENTEWVRMTIPPPEELCPPGKTFIAHSVVTARGPYGPAHSWNDLADVSIRPGGRTLKETTPLMSPCPIPEELRDQAINVLGGGDCISSLAFRTVVAHPAGDAEGILHMTDSVFTGFAREESTYSIPCHRFIVDDGDLAGFTKGLLQFSQAVWDRDYKTLDRGDQAVASRTLALLERTG